MKKIIGVIIVIKFTALLLQGNLAVIENSNQITLSDGANTVLVYHKNEVEPPEGTDPIYKRSAFIHPIRTPNGEVLTSIHPSDHIHHMGLWHAWVKTSHENREIDFWNLKKSQGTVQYAKTLSLHRSESEIGFSVIQNHVAFTQKKNQKPLSKKNSRLKYQKTKEVT